MSALGFEIEMELAPLLVLLRYDDVPGVIGRVGTLLGEVGVNIANMAVSRTRRGGKALMALSIDSEAPPELVEAARAALAAAGVDDGHLAVTLVGEEEIRRLNREHRGRDAPTDVLSFPLDAAGPVAGPRELGDVVICPEHTVDLREAVVHGVLHLCGMDHETDDGEMLALQAEILGS